jgi:hypothetical protein
MESDMCRVTGDVLGRTAAPIRTLSSGFQTRPLKAVEWQWPIVAPERAVLSSHLFLLQIHPAPAKRY